MARQERDRGSREDRILRSAIDRARDSIRSVNETPPEPRWRPSPDYDPVHTSRKLMRVHPHPTDRAEIESAVRRIILAVGEDPLRTGLKETPQRVARMY